MKSFLPKNFFFFLLIILGIYFFHSCVAKKNIKKPATNNKKISQPIPSGRKVTVFKNKEKEIYFPEKNREPIEWETKKDTIKKDTIDY